MCTPYIRIYIYYISNNVIPERCMKTPTLRDCNRDLFSGGVSSAKQLRNRPEVSVDWRWPQLPSLALWLPCAAAGIWRLGLQAWQLWNWNLLKLQKKLQFKLKISDKLHSHALGLHQIKSLSDRRGRFGSACRSWLLGPHVGVRQDLNSLEAAAALPAPPVSGCVVEHRWPALSGQGKQIDTFMQIVLVPSPASKGTASTWTERCEHCLHSCIFHKESRLCYL